MPKSLPSPEVLRKLLRYDPDAGKLFWNERPRIFFSQARHWMAWNKRYAGREAFTTINDKGYRQGDIFNKKHYAHRVAWAIFHDQNPVLHLDHINGDRSDNRIHNLRVATPLDNSRSCASALGSSSTFIGVSWHKRNKKWSAQIRINGKQKHLGYFEDEKSAASSYNAAAKKHFGEFTRHPKS